MNMSNRTSVPVVDRSAVSASRGPGWIVVASTAAVALAVGLAGGFVAGTERGRGLYRKERDEAISLTDAATEHRRQAEAKLAAVVTDSRRDRDELAALRAERELKPQSHVRKWAVGEPASLRNPRSHEGEFVHIFETYSAVEDFQACRAANDDEGIRRLEARGQAVRVPNGRPVTVAKVVIDGATNPLYAVRLLDVDGKEGIAYLVQAEFLFPQKVADKLPHLNADIDDLRPRAEMDKGNPFRPR